MDVEYTLSQVKTAIVTKKIAHARHLLRNVRAVANSRFVSGLATNAIRDLNRADIQSALNDTNTAQIIDAKSDYTVML